MKMKLLRVAVLAVTPVALSACSYLGAQFTNDKVQYESSNSRAPLEVPPDLSQVPHDNLYNVPQRTRDVSASSMQQGQQAAAANRTSAAQSTVLPETVTAKVMRDGDIRWVHTQVPAQQLWPVVQDFWASVGLTIKNQDPKTGYIETEWAENKARLPQDIIRATLESLAYQTYDVLKAMEADSGIKLGALKVDGGASANNLLMQMQSDISGAPVQRPTCVETTAMGAAYLAGLAVGYWASKEDVVKNWAIDRTFAPNIGAEEREKRIHGWNKALRCAYGWAKD